jgi:hypothetical protein
MTMKAVEILSPKEIAMRELEQEQQEKAVALMKDKLMQLRKAQKIVANLEREIEDLELKIQDGQV